MCGGTRLGRRGQSESNEMCEWEVNGLNFTGTELVPKEDSLRDWLWTAKSAQGAYKEGRHI